MPYYFCCSYPLRANSIVEKGNWGRMLKLENEVPLETTFERIRQQEFPDHPSRLECMFLCPTLESIRFFLSQTGRKWDLIYEVELVNTNANIFEADWTILDRELLNTEERREEAARRYWNSETVVDENRKEILVDSAIRILRRIDRTTI